MEIRNGIGHARRIAEIVRVFNEVPQEAARNTTKFDART